LLGKSSIDFRRAKWQSNDTANPGIRVSFFR